MSFRIPIWTKAIFFGFIILEFGTRLWSLLALANLKLTPDIPWSYPLMLFVLLLVWKYLDGKGPPKSTQKNRNLWMRANALAPDKRKWGWISAILLGMFILMLIVFGARLMDVPSGQIDQIERISIYPFWTIVSLIIMTSLVAGIIEEISFRGYMQKPMETKYGPTKAILIVAAFFTLLHLPNATITPHIIPIFFVGSTGWGVLAYLTNSIIPGVVIHSIVDIISYLWIWRNLEIARTFYSESIIKNGIDLDFMILISMLIILLTLLIYSFGKLHKINKLKS